MQTFNPSIDALFQDRFDTMANDDTSDFLGICFGSKRCKRRRDERRKAREQRRRAHILQMQAKAEGVRNGTSDGKSTVENILGSLGGLASSILGGGAGAASAAAADTAENYAGNQPVAIAPNNNAPKKKNTMLYLIIAVVVVGVIGFVLMKKK